MDIGMEMTKQLNSTLLDNFNIATDFKTLLVHQLPEFPPVLTGRNEHVLVERKKIKAKNNDRAPCLQQFPLMIMGETPRLGKGKKAKNEEKVIHVRAKRGQATDSHSLAERVRREKINEKTLFQAATSYFHSLQNQVEFLSMEFTAAASSYDLNLEIECIRKTQGTSSHVGQKMDMEKRIASI
ncbi:Transcription factor BEE 1 [Hibiscus syriacus]|uniref:Transcription factor BEE 1 n=1 Tax=Hibiscus syriacus TaxID=106335 RepID=A0A6A3BAZ8_HIBSY|nr:Transcription factor BEE 1 [Hibiscus syriacus]